MMKTKKQTDKRKRSARPQGAECPADDVALFDVPFEPMGFQRFGYQIRLFKGVSNDDGHLAHLMFFAGYDGRDCDKVLGWHKLGEYDPRKEGLDIFLKSDGLSPLPWTGDECEDYTIDAMRSVVECFKRRWGAVWDWTPKNEKQKFDVECVAEVLNPYGGGGSFSSNARAAKGFILDMLEYPRVVMDDGRLIVGGGLFGDDTYISGDVGVGQMFAGEFSNFKAWIAWIGRRCGCRGKAEAVLGWAGEVFRWVETCRAIDKAAFNALDRLLEKLEAALFDMSVAVADSYVPELDGKRSKYAGKTVRGKGYYKGLRLEVSLSGRSILLGDRYEFGFSEGLVDVFDLLIGAFESGEDDGFVKPPRKWRSNVKRKAKGEDKDRREVLKWFIEDAPKVDKRPSGIVRLRREAFTPKWKSPSA